MKRFCNPLTAVSALLVLGLFVAAAPSVQAADSDISMTVSGPASSSLGDAPLLTVDYANAGPETAESAYINAYIPGGLPMPISILTQDAYDTLQNTGATFDGEGNMLTTTDTLGNIPFLFIEDGYCEHLLFQLQGPDDNPVQGLTSGGSGSFTFNPQLPMDAPPMIGKVKVYEPADLAITFRPASTGTNFLQASGSDRYSRGADCDTDPENLCADLEFCFGARVSEMDLVDAELELADDGTATPTLGCFPFVNTTMTGKIALMERGDCEFGDKVFNAELAGAVAVFMVNDGRCGDFPSSDECVLNMGGGDIGGLASIPVVQVSITDGTPILDAVTAGTTVRMLYGPQGDTYYIDGGSFLLNVGDTDPDESNNEMLFVSAVETVTEPVAAFTYDPADPEAGQTVTFTDASEGPPDTWAWDFGDGGTSTEPSPTHVFATADTFTVSLTVTNSVGTDTTTMDVTTTLPQNLTESYFIPAAAYAAGAAGSFFQTDADINNSGATVAVYAFQWLPRRTNNSSPLQSDNFTLAAGTSMRYENVLSEVFGLEAGAVGALSVISNSTELLIGSRTYNIPTAKVAGTFGQAIPGIFYDDLIMQGETKRIIFMSENDDLRANLGCVNGTNANLRVVATLYGDDGTMLESRNMDLAPWSFDQHNQLFGDYAPTNGYVDVVANGAGAAYYCYGSVLDNMTSDPTTILPTEYGMATTYFIAAAASAPGAAGSFFQTDVDINNAGAAMATYQFLWLPRRTNNSTPTTSDPFTLAAGASVRYENVLSEVFGLEPGAVGALSITSDSADLGIMSRTYNLPTAKVAGTFGQAIPGVAADNLIMQGDTQRIIFMSENDDLRANLGCVNGVNANLRVVATLYGDDGMMLETRNMDLAPWSFDQFNQLFGDYAPTNGYVDVVANGAGAAYYCYGSVLDNMTSDPTTILPQ